MSTAREQQRQLEFEQGAKLIKTLAEAVESYPARIAINALDSVSRLVAACAQGTPVVSSDVLECARASNMIDCD
jgi:hypothetical protein